jgi:hypothetical protein
MRSIQVLIEAIFLADDDVIGKVDLNCAFDEVSIFVIASLLAHFPSTIVELLNDVFIL